MSKIVEIEQCSYCPWSDDEDGIFYCVHPFIEKRRIADELTIAEWCPLEEAE